MSDQIDPLHELWLRARNVLGPFGIAVEPGVLRLWREQAHVGRGPIVQAGRGDAAATAAVEELVALLRLLTGTGDGAAD